MSNNINTEKQVNDLEKAFADLRREVSQAVDVLQDYKKTTQKLPSDYLNSLNKIKDAQEQYNKTISRANGELEQYAANKKEEQRINKALLTAKAKLNQSTSKEAQELAKLRFETNQQNRATREAATLSSKLATEYQKLVVKMNQAGRSKQNLTAKQAQGIKLTDKEQKELIQSSIQYDRYRKAVMKADESIDNHFRKVGNYENAIKGLRTSFMSLVSAFGLTSGVLIFADIVRNSIQTVKEFNSGLIDVGKTTGLTGDELDGLGDDIVNLSQKLRVVGVQSLLEYATVAGQLGVKGSKNIIAFSEALAKLETASDISGQEGGANIARLLTIVDGGVENVNDFADEIVKLGNNFAATENEILSNSTAIAQNTGQYKLGRQEALAYGVATKAVGIESEITGSTIGKTLGIIEKAIRTGQGLDEITKLLGKSQEELNKQFKENSGSVLTDLVKALNEVDKAGGSVNGTLEELGITAVRDRRVIASLATGGYGVLEKALQDVTTAQGAATEEFENASKKISAAFDSVGFAFDRLILSIEDGDNTIGRFISKSLTMLSDNIDKFSIVLRDDVNALDKWKIMVNNATNGLSVFLPWVEDGNGLFQESVDIIRQDTEARDKNKKEILAQNQAFIQQYGSLAPLTEKQKELTEASEDYLFLLRDDSKELEKNKEVRKKGNLVKESSVKYYQNIISKLEEEQSRLATNSREWQIYEKQINSTKDSLNAFLASVEKVEIVTDIESFEEAWQNVQDILLNPVKIEGLDYDKIESELDQWSKDFEAQQKEIFETHKYYAGLRESLEQELSNNLKDLAFSVVDSIFQKQLESLDNEERINQQKADVAMQFAEGNAEAQAEIQRQLVEEQRRIEQEKIEVERKAFLFQQGFRAGEVAIDTLQSVAEIKAQAAILAANPFTAPLATVALAQIPLVITSGAVATGAILAQTLPAFKDGVRGFDGGLAVVGDGGKHEYIKTPEGEFYKTPKTDTLVNLPKGSDVYKDQTDFNKELDKMLDFNGIFKESRNTKTITIENPGGISEQTYQKGVNRLEKAINSKSALQVVFDESGNHKYILKGQAKRELLNKVFKIESRRV